MDATPRDRHRGLGDLRRPRGDHRGPRAARGRRDADRQARRSPPRRRRAIGAPAPAAAPAARRAGLGRTRRAGRRPSASTLLANLARALATARDERTAIETAIAHLAGAVDAEIVAAARLNRDEDRLEIAGLRRPARARRRRRRSRPAPASSARWSRRERSVLVGDVRADDRYVGLPELPDVRSELAVPVFDRGELWGVLNLESDRVDAYGDDDVRLVQAVSVQLGRALRVRVGVRPPRRGRLGRCAPTSWRRRCRSRGQECWRVADLAWRLGRELGLAGEDLESLYLGAPLPRRRHGRRAREPCCSSPGA